MRHTTSNLLVIPILTAVLLASTACNADVTVPETATATPLIIITATLPPTQTPRPSASPVPVSPTGTTVPAEGQTISQINVRSAPSADSDQLGTVEIFAKVQIVGKDPTSGWWMIVYPASPSGTGWITAQFVQVPDSSNVPVIGGQAPAATKAPNTGAGTTTTTGSGEIPTAPASSNLATAFLDGDSLESPAVSVTLSTASVHSFNYSSDISFPEGDADDWVRFTLDGQTGQQTQVSVRLDCSGSGNLRVQLIQNSVLLQGWDDVPCGRISQLQLSLFAGAPYYLQLSPSQGNIPFSYVAYTVSVQLMK